MPVKIERVPDYLKRDRLPGEKVILVDRLWPRGIKKETLDIDQWMKDIGPSHELRKWFAHDPVKWEAFQIRYKAEINDDDGKLNQLKALKALSRAYHLTLIFNARDSNHSQARVIKELLD